MGASLNTKNRKNIITKNRVNAKKNTSLSYEGEFQSVVKTALYSKLTRMRDIKAITDIPTKR